MLIEIYPLDCEELCRALGIPRSLTVGEREKIDDSDFAWPDAPEHPKYPIDTQAHLDAAATLIGRAPENVQAKIKSRAISIAKRKGLSLPESWQEEAKERVAPDALTSESLSVYFPITRVDATSRIVTGQATVEKPDSYGTIFGYCPEAWTMWRGNMREQHDPKKAVGKAFKVFPDEQERAIYVDSKVSRGAQDTWLKIEDGVLSGYSASVIPDPEFGSDPKRWPTKEYQGKLYPYLPRYTVAELSYVDNPATPGCNISLVRADGFVTEVVDVAEDEPLVVPQDAQKPIERAGARIGADTMSKMHDSIGHTLRAAAAQMGNCGCDNCSAAMKLIDPDGDGDIDMGGYDDPDGDWQALYGGGGTSDADMERKLVGIVERALSPVYSRLQGIAGTLARSNAKPTTTDFESLVTSAITRAIDATMTANESSLAEVRASLETVKETVDRIDKTPMPGAPVLNTSAVPRPIDKSDPYSMPRRSGSSVYDAVAAMSAAGQLDTVDKQVGAVAAALAAQHRG